MILAHYNSHLPGSRDPPTSPSQVAGTTDMCHNTQLLFGFLVETGFHHIGQAVLRHLTSGDLPASASQNAGITCVRHCTWPQFSYLQNEVNVNIPLQIGIIQGVIRYDDLALHVLLKGAYNTVAAMAEKITLQHPKKIKLN